jgi:hypothetical protein
MIHASRKEGGLGVFFFTALDLQCGATELLVRLNGAGIGGKVARCRYKAALAAYPQWHSADRSIPSMTRKNFTLYTALLLRRLGYNLMGPENSERVQNHFCRGTRLSDYIPGQPALLANLKSKGL